MKHVSNYKRIIASIKCACGDTEGKQVACWTETKSFGRESPVSEIIEWVDSLRFNSYDLSEPMAIIHFT
jgi:hypothetical protein